MNKEELRKTIVKELKYVLPTELGEKTINYFANNIIVNLPNDFETIKTMTIHEGNKALIEFDCEKYVGKQIEIGIRVIR